MLQSFFPLRVLLAVLLIGLAMIAVQIVTSAQSDTGTASLTVATLGPDETSTPPATTTPSPVPTQVPTSPTLEPNKTTISTLPKTGIQDDGRTTQLMVGVLIAGASALLVLAVIMGTGSKRK